jgi:hypothetical protein
LGHLNFPYLHADAGNFYLQAGEDITITWEQAPFGADAYEFIYTSSDDGVSQTIGIDYDVLNGATTMMKVPENLNGQLVGLAQYGDGYQIWSISSMVYSGELPPVGVCSLLASGVGVVNIYLEPAIDSPRFAYLIPGTYAPVLKKVNTDWYLIDASVAIDSMTNTTSQGEGWINYRNSSLSLHGSCEEIPNE